MDLTNRGKRRNVPEVVFPGTSTRRRSRILNLRQEGFLRSECFVGELGGQICYIEELQSLQGHSNKHTATVDNS